MKLALLAPAGTVTLAGTLATDVLLVESVTSAPPVGAAFVSVTVPCEELPPLMFDGLSVSVESAAVPPVCGAEPFLISNARTTDHAPFVPPALRPRTRHQ